ncbi:hypothetical protein M406DRAFT_332448 [Cryphonectria parasitica EP155]|uniref:Uncharacterized protein n=1 Tax=Cryphonectria parasitica (strain ATCC 38755 / EP155) TaxID=660469 RepID=A0A9P4XZY0_CRYP1|nr:uncharacterized protein M406DRAFT_332448 [Cryphonectria parasitica EP155]KAF3764011.1 hypothetical protein M406DRAFT_332448 [Cryphonectria parasitica EP155]
MATNFCCFKSQNHSSSIHSSSPPRTSQTTSIMRYFKNLIVMAMVAFAEWGAGHPTVHTNLTVVDSTHSADPRVTPMDDEVARHQALGQRHPDWNIKLIDAIEMFGGWPEANKFCHRKWNGWAGIHLESTTLKEYCKTKRVMMDWLDKHLIRICVLKQVQKTHEPNVAPRMKKWLLEPLFPGGRVYKCNPMLESGIVAEDETFAGITIGRPAPLPIPCSKFPYVEAKVLTPGVDEVDDAVGVAAGAGAGDNQASVRT